MLLESMLELSSSADSLRVTGSLELLPAGLSDLGQRTAMSFCPRGESGSASCPRFLRGRA